MFELMLPALVISLVLVAIHGYLGIHIIARGVIFVDLALAQVAAMGWAAANLGLSHGIERITGIPEDIGAFIIGVGTTVLAAALFSVSRMQHRYVPQEAIIGIVYVVASAGTILLAAQAPQGAEHVEELLTGSLLWVGWPEIIRTSLIYLVIGVALYFLHDRLVTISLQPEKARDRKWSLRWWDFLFYALFGIVVTSAVAIAGVLVVFSLLVIPAVIAFLFTDRPARLLLMAWSAGTLSIVLGLYVSFAADLPTGPMVVIAFAAVLVAAFAIRGVLTAVVTARERTPGPATNASMAAGAGSDE